MSKYRPRDTFTRMLSPPLNGSDLFSSSKVTSPFLESCVKFRVKYWFIAFRVIRKDFFFFLSISDIIFSIFSFSLEIIMTFSSINSTCLLTSSKTSRARRFTFPRRESLNWDFWRRSLICSTGRARVSTWWNSVSSDFRESI